MVVLKLIIDIMKKKLGVHNSLKGKSQSRNIKLTLDILELMMKSNKKGLRQF